MLMKRDSAGSYKQRLSLALNSKWTAGQLSRATCLLRVYFLQLTGQNRIQNIDAYKNTSHYKPLSSWLLSTAQFSRKSSGLKRSSLHSKICCTVHNDSTNWRTKGQSSKLVTHLQRCLLPVLHGQIFTAVIGLVNNSIAMIGSCWKHLLALIPRGEYDKNPAISNSVIRRISRCLELKVISLKRINTFYSNFLWAISNSVISKLSLYLRTLCEVHLFNLALLVISNLFRLWLNPAGNTQPQNKEIYRRATQWCNVSPFFYAKIMQYLARRRSSQPVQRVYWPFCWLTCIYFAGVMADSMRNAICAATQTSKVPTRVALLYRVSQKKRKRKQ